jgi:hypothetical protein
MAPKISVSIDDQGQIVADFVAFPGRSCESMERRLREEMARWGLEVRGSVSPKSDSQISRELVEDLQSREKLWKKVSF